MCNLSPSLCSELNIVLFGPTEAKELTKGIATSFEMEIRPPPPPVYSFLIESFPESFNRRVEARLKSFPNRNVTRDGITNSYPDVADGVIEPDDSEFAKFIQVRI